MMTQGRRRGANLGLWGKIPLGFKATRGGAGGRVGTGAQFGRWLPTNASDNSETAGLGWGWSAPLALARRAERR